MTLFSILRHLPQTSVRHQLSRNQITDNNNITSRNFNLTDPIQNQANQENTRRQYVNTSMCLHCLRCSDIQTVYWLVSKKGAAYTHITQSNENSCFWSAEQIIFSNVLVCYQGEWHVTIEYSFRNGNSKTKERIKEPTWSWVSHQKSAEWTESIREKELSTLLGLGTWLLIYHCRSINLEA